MIKQSWHYMILGYKMAPIIRGWFRSTFWGQLTFVVSWYTQQDICILLWCCHHPAHLINLWVSFTFFFVHLILGLSASSLVTLQSRLMCCLCKPYPPQKPIILLVVLLRIAYDHTHLEVDMHPAKTIHPEIIILARIFDGRIQKLRAFVVTTISGNKGKGYHHLTFDLIETFWDHSPQDQVVETPTSNIQEWDDWWCNALVSDIV